MSVAESLIKSLEEALAIAKGELEPAAVYILEKEEDEPPMEETLEEEEGENG